MKENPGIHGVFFDLDGTLLDTAPDLMNACNVLLKKYERPMVPLSQFRQWVSMGTKTMICQSFDINAEHELYLTLREEFLAYYQQQLVVETQLFPGIDQLLNFLDERQMPWGIVTGKSIYLAQPILEHFGLFTRSCCLVGGDSVSKPKPDPEPLFHACKLAEVQPNRCVYVGDADVDIAAARAANMISVAVTYGYHHSQQDPHQWQADYVVSTPRALLECLQMIMQIHF